MKTLDEVLEIMHRRIERDELEAYIAREWVRPHQTDTGWYFEEIDIARIQLVCHLTQDIEVNDEGMDIVLSLLDQLYGTRAHIASLTQAIQQQPEETRMQINSILKRLLDR